MSPRARSAIVIGVVTAAILGLYRNFGVPVLRFWPLILIDTLTRFPGDNLLGVLDLRIPEANYELFRGLLQIPMAILWRWGATRSIRGLRSKKREANPPATQVVLPRAETWIMKKWKLLVASALLGALLFIPRCGRQLSDLVSWTTGVHPYPLHVVTEVQVEAPELRVETRYFSGPRSREIVPGENAYSPGASESQGILLSKKRRAAPLLRPGQLTIKSLPAGMSQEQAAWLEQRALDILNAFEDVEWHYAAAAVLVLSNDGTRALYKIDVFSYDGPLAAIGSIYAVEFIRAGERWVAERFGLVALWMS